MTTMFEARERAFEAKWAHDEEMQFLVMMRRNELLGRWAAQELGLIGAESERYVRALMALGLKSKDSVLLLGKLRTDLGVAHSNDVILARMDDFLQAASLDAGLRPASTGEKTVAAPAGRRSARMDVTRILEWGDGGAAREGQTHFRMLRKITARTP